MKFTEDYTQQVRKEFINLPESKRTEFLYNLVLNRCSNYLDLRNLLNISIDNSINIFKRLNIKICSNSNCLNGKRIQPRENFSKASTKDGLNDRCKKCVKEIEKKRRERLKKENSELGPLEIKYKVCGNPECIHGNKEQLIENFNRTNNTRDGYTNRCKDCQNEQAKYRNIINREKNKNLSFSKTSSLKICSNSNCIHNGEEQSIKNFVKTLSNTDGYSSWCRDCLHRKGKRYRYSKANFDTYFKQLELYEYIRRNPEDSNHLQVRCYNSNCQKWFTPTVSQVQSRIGSINGSKVGENNFYCSNECKNQCPVFGQRIYRKDNSNGINLDREVQPELRKLVFERDNWTCQKCNQHKDNLAAGMSLHCHHIEGIHWEPLESADIDMCITTCNDCHKEIHQIPGCTYQDMQCNSNIT